MSPSTLSVAEGTSATCTVGLNFAPAGNVDVSVTRGSGAIPVNKAGGTAGASQSLSFTTSNWEAQAITVTALEDANAISGDVTITHAVVNALSSSGFDPASDKTLTATDDDAGLSVSPQTVAEGIAYTVALKAQPSRSVTVTHTAATGSGTPFTCAARATEHVTVTIDDETPGVTEVATSVSLQEDPSAGGGTSRHVGTYTIVLGSAISGGAARSACGC